jgi:hypothetical protein
MKGISVTQSHAGIHVYVETGSKRVFASALDWPGWCRSGRDETAALEALVAYGPRYARAIRVVDMAPVLPAATTGLLIDERLAGSSTTDFGAPAAVPTADLLPVDDGTLDRLTALLRACWLAFDRAATAAEGKPLRKGPRGGGRDLPRMIGHVAGSTKSYLAGLGWKAELDPGAAPLAQVGHMVDEATRALAAAAAGELPTQGSRGGKRWTLRTFVRRTAWHLLDHAWEIEDRLD